MKIISLVPSITETLFDFGLTNKEIIGRTKFCIHPKEKVNGIEKVGGTKNIQIDKIKYLNPDLIIANKEENTKEEVEELQKRYNVWVTDIANFEENLQFVSELGKLLKKEQMAEEFNTKMQSILAKNKLPKTQKVAYLIWKSPYMSIGKDTYIHDILQHLGYENILKNKTRYPEISLEDLKTADALFLSSEPYPFGKKHINEIQHILPNTTIKLVDGEVFSWYGTHLMKSETYLQDLQSD